MEKPSSKTKKQLDALYKMVLCGHLSQSFFEEKINEAIEAELCKPSHLMDAALISYCTNLLNTFHPTTACRKSKNHKALAKKIKAAQSPYGYGKWLTRVVTLSLGLTLGIFGLDMALTRQSLVVRQSEDEQQYILEVSQLANGTLPLVNASGVDGLNPTYTTTSLADVVHYLGYMPPMPKQAPQGWQIYDYTVVLFDQGHEVYVYYTKSNQSHLLQYTYKTSTNLSDLQNQYEQSISGLTQTTGDNQKIYFSYNIHNITAVWQMGNIIFELNGPITQQEALETIGSLPKW